MSEREGGRERERRRREGEREREKADWWCSLVCMLIVKQHNI